MYIQTTVVSGNEASIIFDMTPENIAFWISQRVLHLISTSRLLAKVRFDHPNVALDALARTPLWRWSDSGIRNITFVHWSLLHSQFFYRELESRMEIQLWLLHLDRSNGSFISGHQVSVGDLKEQCFSRAVSHRHLEMVQQSFNKRCFFATWSGETSMPNQPWICWLRDHKSHLPRYFCHPRWKWIHSPWTSAESQETAPLYPTSVVEFSGVFAVFFRDAFLYLQLLRL